MQEKHQYLKLKKEDINSIDVNKLLYKFTLRNFINL